ncbi:hypothetical protein Slin14017_G097330 [Septoria linicola]|nr:hypothetical protein Slin14017_G097330 [Septoria linicola]
MLFSAVAIATFFSSAIAADASTSKPKFNFVDLGGYLADDAANYLNLRADENEATVCVNVAYTVQNDSLARDVGVFALRTDERNTTYECFILGGPNTFALDLEPGAPVPDSVTVIPGPGRWNQTAGVLTL